MVEKDIIQNMIFQLGQSQDTRMPKELKPHFADVDERSLEELMNFTKIFAQHVNYYRNDIGAPAGNWENFFSFDTSEIHSLLDSRNGKLSPHLALFLSFLKLYKEPQELLNGITGRHLDFYYQDVLRFKKKPEQADRVHVLIEMKKNAVPIRIGPEHSFSAGKDISGVELIYAPTADTVIGSAAVDSVRSIYLDNHAYGTVRYAPIANSVDGIGGKLKDNEVKWHGFGHEALPLAEVGFAISSPVLRMKEGTRKVTAFLTLRNVDSLKVNKASLEDAFEVFVTGEKNWLGPYSISPVIDADNVLKFDFTMPEDESAVIDYDAVVHGCHYVTGAPVIQILLKADSFRVGYNNFRDVVLEKASVSVEVTNVRSLRLESDDGVLDPKKAFMPFGREPTIGSCFKVGCNEALCKKLSELKISVQWKGAPSKFFSHYIKYGKGGINNGYFTAKVSFNDGGSWHSMSHGIKLFDLDDAASEHTFKFAAGTTSVSQPASEGSSVYALNSTGSSWATSEASEYVMRRPVFGSFKTAIPEQQEKFITFLLEKDFLHSDYRKKFVEKVIEYAGGTLDLLNEPYTPVIQSISLSYKAHSDEAIISSVKLDDFANNDIQFFHVTYFGQMREHGYQRYREQFAFIADKNIPLLPEYSNEGEMLIGFKDLSAGDSVSVLFQVAEGSEEPDLEQEDIEWSVLCDNYWKPLGRSEVVLDTTNKLLKSGIITFIIPAGATKTNTILPSGLLWIKGAVRQNVSALCQLIEVSANAVEVQFIDRGNDPEHLRKVMEKGKISRLKNGLSGVKSIKQPYASFGGRAVESNDAFYMRVSERLRHKNRCITSWDYERIILEAFPEIYKVKCIPHAREGCWLSPGNVLIVVIPDLKNKNAVNPLEPKVNADTINRISAHLQKRKGMQVRVKVKNPRYQKIQLDFKVKFHRGYEFNYYSSALMKEIIRFISPWAFQGMRDMSFGGAVYKSVLLDFVEEIEYVDFITEFKMYTWTGASGKSGDVDSVEPETPDTILVSHDKHIIGEAGKTSAGEF